MMAMAWERGKDVGQMNPNLHPGLLQLTQQESTACQGFRVPPANRLSQAPPHLAEHPGGG